MDELHLVQKDLCFSFYSCQHFQRQLEEQQTTSLLNLGKITLSSITDAFFFISLQNAISIHDQKAVSGES